MFEIKKFTEFSKRLFVSEGLFDANDVWKIDTAPAEQGDLGTKFTFKLKVQHREDAPPQEVANKMASELIQNLSNTERFVADLKFFDRIAVLYTDRDTTGGLLTGDRGVLTGSIRFIAASPEYDPGKLKMLDAFKPEGATTQVIVKGIKVYDGKTINMAKRTAGAPPNLNGPGQSGPALQNDPNAYNYAEETGQTGGHPGAVGGQQSPQGGQATSGEVPQTANAIKTLKTLAFGASGPMIQKLNAILTILKPAVKTLLTGKDGKILDKFVEATAQAIPQVLNMNQQMVTQITDDVAKALVAKIATVSNDQLNAALAGAAQAAQAVSPELGLIQGYVTGLKLGDKNLKVGMLQQALMIMSPAAKAILEPKGGADNQYGNATAQAIQTVLGQPTPVNEVTADIAKSLIEKAAALTPDQVKQIMATLNQALSGGSQVGGSSSGKNQKPPRKGGSSTPPEKYKKRGGAKQMPE